MFGLLKPESRKIFRFFRFCHLCKHLTLSELRGSPHSRHRLTPNICAVYTEEAYRGQGIAGRLLNQAVEDLRTNGISPVYLLTNHTGFYERYGWGFLCMVQGDGEP